MKIRFISDFAKNWKAGDIVEVQPLPDGDTLVDNVAVIDTALLMEHCEVVSESGDNVNHPNHYNIPGRKECIVEMLEKFGKEAVITFCILNAYKYRYRHELKGGKEDLEKAKWYDNYARKLAESEVVE
jgi:hypothetical protein